MIFLLSTWVSSFLPPVVIAAIVAGIISYFVKRSLADKNRQNEEKIETLKSELDILKNRQIQYSENRTKAYTDLWEVLCETKHAVDILWLKTMPENVDRLRIKINGLKNKLEKVRVFIEESHYDELKEIIIIFLELEFHNTKLADVTNIDYIDDYTVLVDYNIDYKDIIKTLENNAQLRVNLDKIMYKFSDLIKTQLSGNWNR